jgi:hypothetical protein
MNADERRSEFKQVLIGVRLHSSAAYYLRPPSGKLLLTIVSTGQLESQVWWLENSSTPQISLTVFRDQ